MRRRLFISILSLLPWLVGCDRAQPPLIEQQFYVFGTLVSISFYGIEQSQANTASAEIQALFQQMHQDWHAWQKGALEDLNQAIAEGRDITVHPSLLPLIKKSQAAYRQSGGLFNPTIGKLVRLWGFHSSDMPSGALPPAEQIAALVAEHPSMDDVEINGGSVHSRNPAVQMDFGGIAKGYAIELALKRLRELGIENAMVNAGGGLGVIGMHGDRPWRIGIRHPLGQSVLGSLAVYDGEHIHTSGNYERFREWEGKRYSHIIDPRSGWPIQEVVSATVIHADGALADAFTKPLIIGGIREWYPIAKRLGVKSVMLVDTAGTVYMDPSMARRVRFEGSAPKIVVSAPLN